MNKKFFLKLFSILLISMIFFQIFVNYSYADTTNTSNISTTNGELTLYSKASILIDSSSGQIIYEHNAYEKMYPASTTKLMTAILTLENCNLTDTVIVDKNALSGIPKGYTTAALQPGESLTVDQLLHVLLIPSANDAANVLAYHIAGSVDDFSIMMNAKAKEIGCKNTHFVNPSGIHNDEHYSTAYDMALIGKYANSFDTVKEFTCQTKYSLPNLPNGSERTFKTTNTLITPGNKYFYEYATGLKTGYTDDAKSCIVAKAKKNDIELICVVLGGDKTDTLQKARETDCHTLFDYGFNNYKAHIVCTRNSILDKTNLSDVPSEFKNENVLYAEDLALLVKTSNTNDIQSTVNWNTSLSLPISKNSVVGSVTYSIDGAYYTVNLITENDILPMKSNSISSIFYILIGLFILILLITIFSKKNKNKFHKKSKSSDSSKYFRHSFY